LTWWSELPGGAKMAWLLPFSNTFGGGQFALQMIVYFIVLSNLNQFTHYLLKFQQFHWLSHSGMFYWINSS
jgi:hypothetical protein